MTSVCECDAVELLETLTVCLWGFILLFFYFIAFFYCFLFLTVGLLGVLVLFFSLFFFPFVCFHSVLQRYTVLLLQFQPLGGANVLWDL